MSKQNAIVLLSVTVAVGNDIGKQKKIESGGRNEKVTARALWMIGKRNN